MIEKLHHSLVFFFAIGLFGSTTTFSTLFNCMRAQSQCKDETAVNKQGSPLACNLTALNKEQRERRLQLAKQLQSSVKELRELPDGYAFRLPAEPTICLQAAEFITLESRCCPFLTLTIELEREGGPLWLRLTGQQGVKEFLRAELGIAEKTF
ncbi:MAG: hypothetical protein AB1489_23050 [Acidobacteriota bacterium]